MLNFELLNQEGILRVSPNAPLQVRDFAQLSEVADRYLASHEALKGLIITTDDFEGWEDFSALVSHVKFVREHHKHIRKVAVVSDDSRLKIMPAIASHFVDADIRHFDSGHQQEAFDWINPADSA